MDLVPSDKANVCDGNRTEADSSWEDYKRQQARISRHRLYPVTVFYTAYAIVVSVFAFRSNHPGIALLFLAAAVPVWTLVEFFFHRYILHGRFAPGKGFIRRFAHERLDPLHWEHHARPYDGLHINGAIGDLLGLFVVAAPISFVTPIYTLPILLAGVVECYVIEEWVHHSVHYYDFRDPYFQYMKRHHGFHHAPAGTELGYGLTNGVWDVVFNTDYSEEIKTALYGKRRSLSPWRRKQKPLWDLDRIIGPALISEVCARSLSPEQAVEALLAKPEVRKAVSNFRWPRDVVREVMARFPADQAVDMLLAYPEVAKKAASLGSQEEIVGEALDRYRKYGLTAAAGGRLTVPAEGRLRAYVAI